MFTIVFFCFCIHELPRAIKALFLLRKQALAAACFIDHLKAFVYDILILAKITIIGNGCLLLFLNAADAVQVFNVQLSYLFCKKADKCTPSSLYKGKRLYQYRRGRVL